MAIEDPDAARERGAKVLGHVLGHGAAFGQPEGHALFGTSSTALARAAAQALDDASASPEDVDLVLTGMGGFSAYDDLELTAISRVLGSDVAVAAPKRLLGETFGAASSLSMAAALAWIHEEMPVPLVRGKLARRPRRVLVTELGFYGNASAVLLGAP
jgi:3-oxoacyl-(acyl-carrier-protein) synthase